MYVKIHETDELARNQFSAGKSRDLLSSAGFTHRVRVTIRTTRLTAHLDSWRRTGRSQADQLLCWRSSLHFARAAVGFSSLIGLSGRWSRPMPIACET